MNKTDLINVLAAENEMKKKDVEVIVGGVFDKIAAAMKEGDKVQLIGFGTFEAKEVAAHEGRNPQTGETIEISARKVPTVKFGKTVKELVAE